MLKTLLFAEGDFLPDWVITTLSIVRPCLIAIVAICAIGLIITTLLQSNSNDNNSQALSGGVHESYYSQNKGETRDGKLKKATIIFASIIAVCALLYFITLIINNPTV